MSDSNIKVKVKNLQNNVKYMPDKTDNHCLKACLPTVAGGKEHKGKTWYILLKSFFVEFCFFKGKNVKHKKTRYHHHKKTRYHHQSA